MKKLYAKTQWCYLKILNSKYLKDLIGIYNVLMGLAVLAWIGVIFLAMFFLMNLCKDYLNYLVFTGIVLFLLFLFWVGFWGAIQAFLFREHRLDNINSNYEKKLIKKMVLIEKSMLKYSTPQSHHTRVMSKNKI